MTWRWGPHCYLGLESVRHMGSNCQLVVLMDMMTELGVELGQTGNSPTYSVFEDGDPLKCSARLCLAKFGGLAGLFRALHSSNGRFCGWPAKIFATPGPFPTKNRN